MDYFIKLVEFNSWVKLSELKCPLITTGKSCNFCWLVWVHLTLEVTRNCITESPIRTCQVHTVLNWPLLDDVSRLEKILTGLVARHPPLPPASLSERDWTHSGLSGLSRITRELESLSVALTWIWKQRTEPQQTAVRFGGEFLNKEEINRIEF